MSLLSNSNLNAWKHKTRKAKDDIKSKATDYVRGRVKRVVDDALKVSPQWSGDFAYNWRIEITGYRFAYHDRFKVDPYWDLRDRSEYGKDGMLSRKGSNASAKQAGDREAIDAAKAINYEIIRAIKWNSNIKLVNYAPVATLIESGQVNLRPVNKIPGGAGVMAYLEGKYSFMRS